jgi:hypothetical protein
MDLEFQGEVYYWRGPAPHHFVAVPEEECAALGAVSQAVTYGWGMIPVAVQLGDTAWTTALWPKDGGYIVPLKAWVRKAEGVELGETVTVRLTVDV